MSARARIPFIKQTRGVDELDCLVHDPNRDGFCPNAKPYLSRTLRLFVLVRMHVSFFDRSNPCS